MARLDCTQFPVTSRPSLIPILRGHATASIKWETKSIPLISASTMICLPICVGSNGPVRFQIPNVALCFLKSSALPLGTPFTSICNSFPAVHSPSSIAFPNSTSQDPAFRPYILAGFAHLHKGTVPPANKPSSLLPNTGIENSWTDRPLLCGRDESCATICGIISGSEDIVGHSVIRDVRH